MLIKPTSRQFTGGIIILLALLGTVAGPVSAMMIARPQNAAIGSKILHPAPPLSHKEVSFIAWQGNRLITTAGTFLITKSVRLVDLAGSRYFVREFKGPVPSVHLIFKKRKLIKVVIK